MACVKQVLLRGLAFTASLPAFRDAAIRGAQGYRSTSSFLRMAPLSLATSKTVELPGFTTVSYWWARDA